MLPLDYDQNGGDGIAARDYDRMTVDEYYAIIRRLGLRPTSVQNNLSIYVWRLSLTSRTRRLIQRLTEKKLIEQLKSGI